MRRDVRLLLRFHKLCLHIYESAFCLPSLLQELACQVIISRLQCKLFGSLQASSMFRPLTLQATCLITLLMLTAMCQPSKLTDIALIEL